MTSGVPEQGTVVVVEPVLPRRIRRPSDALRFLITVVALAIALFLPVVAPGTFSGLESDVAEGTRQAPSVLVSLGGFLGGIVVLMVPVAFAVDRVLRRDGLRVVGGLIAATLALLVSLVIDWWLLSLNPEVPLVNALTREPQGGGQLTEPVHTMIASVIAYVTTVRVGRWPRWQAVMWTAIALDMVAILAAGRTTPLALIVTFLIARAVGYTTLYLVGSPNTRPPGGAVVAALRRLALPPVSARRIEDDAEGSRRYAVRIADGRQLDVTVLDRDQQVAGMLYRIWRWIRLNSAARRRPVRPLRRELEREALMAYAAAAAGAHTKRLVATSDLGADTAMLAYEHVDGEILDNLPDERLTDELLRQIWHEVRVLHAARLAHRRLVGDSILVDDTGQVRLLDVRSGEIAAGDIVLRMDVAQLLTFLAMRVGPERSVRLAADVLGADTLAGAVPLLQSVVLVRSTRSALRKEKDLLSRIREQVLALVPQVAVEPVKLERFRPRTVVSIIALALGAYFLLSQLSQVDLRATVTTAQWGWGLVAAVAAAVSYLAAAFMLRGFVPERLPLFKTVLAQLAGSFVKLVAPAAVSGVAINTRFLTRMGVPSGQAVASVGASQLTGLVFHIALLFTFAYITGQESTPSLAPSRGVIIGILAVAILVVVGLAIPRLRRFTAAKGRALFAGVIPRLLDVLQSPRKILEGFGGTLLLTIAFVVCLDASIRAFGGSMSFASVAVVFLAGNAIGSAAPTPGGLGAVEGALVLGLTLAGLPGPTATSAVLLFRLLTFWFPVLPGWASFAYLQRHHAI
ncbi:lysylphosphatidylglycerol synthase transmembrane domain-containing protein [Rhizohabitans arisaemae]|uniref:lysylphosphatidylglycerol synthase transmembrane domain-containing protein n=1 Tax=Rhizohabitans arisaemae TaxID=2720610 RepID=UPI0024B07A9C|nr:lysylphosphatidylglycerol synthase transmembrane domain-containing protein [Rhizohabitans arisaemae]